MNLVAVAKRWRFYPGKRHGGEQPQYRTYVDGFVRRPVEGKDYVQVSEYPFYLIPYGGMQP